MTILRAPVEIRGDVLSPIAQGLPVLRRLRGIDGADAWDTVHAEADGWALLCSGGQRKPQDLCVDWRAPLAIYAALHWLADRGHSCLWMLPITHGGRVEAWDGLTAWEVSAILVSVSVGRVANGGKPIRVLAPAFSGVASRMFLGHEAGGEVCWNATDADRDYFVAPIRLGPDVKATPDHVGWFYSPPIGLTSFGMEVGAEAEAKINAAALTDGAALCVDGGIAVEGP